MSMTTSGAPAPGTNILQPWTAKQLSDDDAATRLIIDTYGKKFTQTWFSTSLTPIYGTPSVVNVPIQNVGLNTKFIVQVSTVVTNPSGGATLTRGSMGPFSTLSSIQYTDPTTNQRINTFGAHMASVTTRRHRRIPGSALTTDSPTGFGSVMTPIACPATIAANASGTVNVMYEVPLAVGKRSLKGAVYLGAVFATNNLQLTFNPNFAQNSTDPALCVFTGASNSVPPTYATTITVWQEYWEQFPLSLLEPLSPSLSTIYEIKNTAFFPLVANADNYVRFTNLRQFLSTMVMFDNGGTLNPGTDILNFKLQSANQTIEWLRSPSLQSYMTRNHYGDDFPAGYYMFDFSDAPIITAAEGNTVLSVNPITVNANAVLNVGWEDLAVSQVLASASSLAGNAGR